MLILCFSLSLNENRCTVTLPLPPLPPLLLICSITKSPLNCSDSDSDVVTSDPAPVGTAKRARKRGGRATTKTVTIRFQMNCKMNAAKQWEKLRFVASTIEQSAGQSCRKREGSAVAAITEKLSLGSSSGGVSQEMQIALITLGIKRCDIYSLSPPLSLSLFYSHNRF